ncbi:MAG: tetratricopeptide repeat protein [Candidatus Omnitrophica bacterium]|nr:tetratricopeptide repeat protein [Candidatus Omnitrophota bacterium]
MKFSIGYNQDIKLLDLLGIYKNNIQAFYFPIPEHYLGTGRYIRQSKDYPNQIPEIIARCNSLNITPQLLLNATAEKKFGKKEPAFKSLLNYLKKLKNLGLKSVVVTNPVYISRIKNEIKDISLESSVNCYIRTVKRALYFKDLGVDVLTIDRDINRNFSLIKEIKDKTGLKIRVMLNEGCLNSCPFRISHYNYLSTRAGLPKNPAADVLMDQLCVDIYKKHPLKLLRIPFIPPEALSYYSQFVDYYKLSTRVFSTERIEFCLKAYLHRHFNGNLLTLLDSPGLAYFEYVDYRALVKSNIFKKMLYCNFKCANCVYCRKLFKQAVLINRDVQEARSREEENKAVWLYKNDLRTVLSIKQRAWDYLKIGEAYFKLNKYPEAIKNINEALKLNYQGSKAYLILGFCYEKLGNYKLAIKALKKEEKINPDDGGINLSLARCYKNLSQLALSEKEVNKVILKVPPQA